MIVLGIYFGHCGSACLMVNGEVIGLVQEERFTRRKNQVGFPLNAIKSLVAEYLGGDFHRIDRIVFSMKTSSPYWTVLDHYNLTVHECVKEMYDYWHPFFYGSQVPVDKADWADAYWHELWTRGERINCDHGFDFSFLDKMKGKEAVDYFHNIERPAVLERHFGWTRGFTEIGHHRSHAYYALYGAPLTEKQRRDALVLTADSRGDHSNWSASIAEPDGRLTRIGRGTDHTVARLYRFTTLILGMKPHEHEYKVMGLASYSNSRKHIKAVERIYFEALDFRDGKFVRERPLTDSYFDLKNRLEGHRFDNIAAGLQNWATSVTKAWARHWLRVSDRRTLCFSGGLSMNIKTNGELLNLPEIDWLSVPGSGGDESIAAGATFAATLDEGRTIRAIQHLYLGGNASRNMKSAGWSDFVVVDGVDAIAVAKLLASDCIVARCVGPAEFGARALGNRSILANPSNPANVKLINDAIKNRDFWMPFTPSILAEHADRYLINPKGVESPFMTIGFQTTELARKEIPAALHPADFSARPQMVYWETNPEYWNIIEAFRQLTGIPALLNTSLNLHGEPMNYSVSDAVRTLRLSELDFLLVPGQRMLCKNRAMGPLERALKLQRAPQAV